MATRTRSAILVAAVAGLLMSTPGNAQQQERKLTEQEVTRFFESAEKDMTEAVRGGESKRLLEWTRKHVADEATFMISTEVYAGDERKSFSVSSLDKKDMLRLGRVITGSMNGTDGQRIQEYDLKIEVTDVDPIGADVAVVATRLTESGKLNVGSRPASEGKSGSQRGSGDGGGQNEARSVTFESTAECKYVVRRGDSADQLMIGMTNCQARTRF